MSMTRKHYNEIANVISAEVALVAKLYKSHIKLSAQYTIRNIVLSLADVLARDNDRFDRKRFYDACGLDERLWPKS